MHDIEDRIRQWTDHASSGAEPVSVEEALARAAVVAGGRRSALGGWRRRGPLLAAAALLAVVTAAAVALALGGGDVTRVATEGFDDEDAVAPEPVEGPWDETAVMRPDLMQLDPAEAYPGDVVELRFPEETLRGIGYVLEEAVEGSWVLRYYLTAGLANESWDGYWRPVDDPEPHFWPDIGIMSPGPERITVPDTATPGDYRVCTANAAENICAPLRILAVGGPYDETAVMRPDLMQLDPAKAYPGDVVELHLPEEEMRGIGYVLEGAVEGSWVLRYYLTAALRDESGDGRWAPVDDPEPYVWTLAGITRPGPDRITVPDTATPGDYRVCTALRSPNICTPFRILAADD